MEEIVEKKLCTGCTACASICPKNAITMIEKNDGFKYPVIDQEKCINCGLCKKICPVLSLQSNQSINKCYVGYSKDSNDKEKSSSGGIFSLVANYILDSKGLVIGAAFNNENKLVHISIDNKNDLLKLKGSKYLQSDLENVFKLVKEKVSTQKILFVGTPCQVAGLKAYLKKDYDNLFCIDLFCHGVPSPKLFLKYVKELENKYNSKLLNYNFRDKTTGWDTYSTTAQLENKTISELRTKNNYMKLFLSDIALRESCYNCSFKLGNKYSDITVGDFWGVKNHYPEMYSKNGVSAIIINSKKGQDIFETLKEKISYKECQLDEIVLGNKSLKYSSIKPIKRETFFRELDEQSIERLTKKYVKKRPLYKKVLGKIKKIIIK